MINSISEANRYLQEKYQHVPDILKPYYHLPMQSEDREKELLRLESSLQVKLPVSYRDFITEYNIATLGIYSFRFNPDPTVGSEDLIGAIIEANQQGRSPHSAILAAKHMLIVGAYEQDDIVLDLNTGELYLNVTDSGELHKLAGNIAELIVIVANLEYANENISNTEERVQQFSHLLEQYNLSLNEGWQMIIDMTLRNT